jgi:gamma-glutamyltranspeptidase/glutathione hydrolase
MVMMASAVRLFVAAVMLGFPPALYAASLPAVEATGGMVVSAQRLAAEAGIEMLRKGGNAIDAAVAVGYAEAVTNPCCGNIGGGGFLTAYLADGRSVFINFREMAPAAASADMYLDAAGQVIAGSSLNGWKAGGVPGTVAGLDMALTRYGTLDRATVMAPAIRLARDGFVLTRGDTDIMARGVNRLRAHPIVARIFLRPDGTSFEPGDRLVQTDLAATLQAIADGGPDAFYRGAIPRKIEAASRDGGGLLTAADFASYRAVETAPIRCGYRGYTILSAPPPSSGGVTLCQILQVLEGYDLKATGYHSARSAHLMIEAMRHAYLDRNTHLGDPAFVGNPLDWLLSPAHAAAIRAGIGPGATLSKSLRPDVAPHEKPETTHYSVMDSRGNAVAVTYTINGLFGAGVIADDTGFLLNNQMDDFTIKVGVPNLFGLVQGEANAIAPGKRPLSSMSPTIVLRDGRVFLVLGSPGGSRIITITLQVILNMIDHGMAPQEAVDAPRLHHQWLPDQVFAERFALSADTKERLVGLGHSIVEQTPWGAAAVIAVGGEAPGRRMESTSGNDSTATAGMRPGFLYGANDPRRPAGAALGYDGNRTSQ